MEDYEPNTVPLDIRAANIAKAIGLLLYGGVGLLINKLVLPTKRGDWLHFSDEPLWLMVAAMFCGATVLVVEVIDHYDRRNNELAYQQFATIVAKLGWILFHISLITWLYQQTIGAS